MFSLLAIAIAAAVSEAGFTGRAPNPDLTAFGSLLASLLFASAILERALDVWLSLAMGGKADELDGEIRALKSKLDTLATDGTRVQVKATADAELKSVQARRTEHSSSTRRMALPGALLGGLAISAVGLRALEPLFQPFDATWASSPQAPWFVAVDVLFTGALLAGGSDGIHWIVALYRDWMDKNRSTRN
ncbi:MAG: hypothetical protein NTV21_14720 [Planctomycetota bacterium]|nr:hypothetical protein [Planctomycetota bacterium]